MLLYIFVTYAGIDLSNDDCQRKGSEFAPTNFHTTVLDMCQVFQRTKHDLNSKYTNTRLFFRRSTPSQFKLGFIPYVTQLVLSSQSPMKPRPNWQAKSRRGILATLRSSGCLITWYLLWKHINLPPDIFLHLISLSFLCLLVFNIQHCIINRFWREEEFPLTLERLT